MVVVDYEPILFNKNYNFKINKIDIIKDNRKINKIIKKNLIKKFKS